jgi:alanine dehydrogenase
VIVGTPKEIKNHEYRVGLTPAGARVLVHTGHRVIVQRGAGERTGFADEAYEQAGAMLVPTAAQVYGQAELVLKVKELQAAETPLARPGQILFCYQHLAPEPELTRYMLESGLTCLAFETVSDGCGGLPLLAPMSRIAGRLAPQVGAWALQMANGGSGVLLGGVPGVPPARVVVIGAGSVGANAALTAVGMGAEVTLFNRSTARLEQLDQYYRGRIRTRVVDPISLSEEVANADLVIGAVLAPGKLAPKLIGREMLRRMRPGSALVDVAIDQGGIAETSRPTTHSDPIYVEEGVVHYCVANMPSACARTATLALAQATLSYALALASHGLKAALEQDAGLKEGLQVHRGRLTHAGLAQDLGLPFVRAEDALNM